MPPPGYEPFLRAICAAPADDLPRLVYADWLDENGDPDRAEFIRCQVADAAGSRSLIGARSRWRTLYARHGNQWRAELPRHPKRDWGPFERGFVGTIGLHGSPQIKELFESAVELIPVQVVKLVRMGPTQWATVFGSRCLAHVRRLEGRSGYADDLGLETLANNTTTGNLESLEIAGSVWGSGLTSSSLIRRQEATVTDRGAFVLARSPYLSRLRHLTFWSSGITAEGRAALSARFAHVSFYGNVLDADSGSRRLV